MLHVHNTLGNRLEPFSPLVPGQVGMYVCGPTVYDYFHIGNARPFITFDVVKRYLMSRGLKVTHVQNVTDIDDKIIVRAQREKRSADEVAKEFTAAYFRDLGKLGVLMPTHNPKATETIPGIIAFIQKLEARGFTYTIDGDVYYRVLKFPSYGKLKGIRLEDLKEGASDRVQEAIRERKLKAGGHHADFALWKARKAADEPAWDSPWGWGRPGWHIECSAMSSLILGDTFDIHAGGQDLKFPHHENEIAQSEGATGKPFVKYWLHNEFINIAVDDTPLTNAQQALVTRLKSAIQQHDVHGKTQALRELEAANIYVEELPEGEIAFKGSKTLGNIPRAFEVFERGFNGPEVRMLMLRAHYRSPITFSWRLLDDARSAVQRWNSARQRLNEALAATNKASAPTEPTDIGSQEPVLAKITEARKRFAEHMDQDFNTAAALGSAFDVINVVNSMLDKAGQASPSALKTAAEALDEFEFVFGLVPAAEAPLSAEEQSLLEARDKARKARQWAEADRLRTELANRGIVVEDSPQGQKWRRK